MATGPARFIETDSRPSRDIHWHLLKTPTTAQTAVSELLIVKKLRQGVFAEDNLDFVDVSWCKAIRIQCWGVGSNNHAPVLDLYGWHENGPGQHIAKVTCTMGNFVSLGNDDNDPNNDPGWHADTNLHPAIKNAFDRATDYRGCDTYAVTADYEQDQITDTAATPLEYQVHKSIWVPGLVSAGGTPAEADMPSFFVLDLTRSRYKYVCAAVTNLGSATSAGAIFKPAVLA